MVSGRLLIILHTYCFSISILILTVMMVEAKYGGSCLRYVCTLRHIQCGKILIGSHMSNAFCIMLHIWNGLSKMVHEDLDNILDIGTHPNHCLRLI